MVFFFSFLFFVLFFIYVLPLFFAFEKLKDYRDVWVLESWAGNESDVFAYGNFGFFLCFCVFCIDQINIECAKKGGLVLCHSEGKSWKLCRTICEIEFCKQNTIFKMFFRLVCRCCGAIEIFKKVSGWVRNCFRRCVVVLASKVLITLFYDPWECMWPEVSISII